MRILFFFALTLSIASIQAQTLQADFETGKSLLLAKKEKDALPYFQKIMAANDESLKRTMINFVSETWLNDPTIAFSKAMPSYGVMGSQYITANFTGKESSMNANDNYTAGIIYWSFASTGMQSETRRAVYLLMAAYQKGNKQALKYLPDAVARLKKVDASVPWTDVLEIHGIAASELNTTKPLTKLGWSNYFDLDGFSKLSKAEKDTAKAVVAESIFMAGRFLPDSLYKVIDYFWLRTYNTFGRQDTLLTGILNGLSFGANPAEVKHIRKGVTWHYLYKYFYENRPKNNDLRQELMTKMKAMYPGEESALLLVISEFLNEARSNTLGLMLSADAKWLKNFTPATLTFADKFFYAAALTEQDFNPFMNENANASAYSPSIVSGFRKRFFNLFQILSDEKENLQLRTSTVSIFSKSSAAFIGKLLERNELKNISSLKHVQADMEILENLSRYRKEKQLPMFFDELPEVFKNWSGSDKRGYDSKYLQLLIETVQKNITDSKNNKWMAEAGGKNDMDYKDYDKAQKTVDKLKTFLN